MGLGTVRIYETSSAWMPMRATGMYSCGLINPDCAEAWHREFVVVFHILLVVVTEYACVRQLLTESCCNLSLRTVLSENKGFTATQARV